ncbi:MAG TPA: hypothetical protein VHL78_09695 [Actinomycetota bacterium]|nr:hypothetical protein [Actinomycetota bacterium]
MLRPVRFSLADLRDGLKEFLEFASPVRFNAEIDIDANRIVIVAGTNEDVTTLRDTVIERRYAVPAEAFTVRRGGLGGPT